MIEHVVYGSLAAAVLAKNPYQNPYSVSKQPTFSDYEKALAQKERVAAVWFRTQDFNDPEYLEALKELKRLEWWTYPNDNCAIVEIME